MTLLLIQGSKGLLHTVRRSALFCARQQYITRVEGDKKVIFELFLFSSLPLLIARRNSCPGSLSRLFSSLPATVRAFILASNCCYPPC